MAADDREMNNDPAGDDPAGTGPAQSDAGGGDTLHPEPAISVVVVSKTRPEILRLCLTGLSQLYYSNFEIVVVADTGAVQAVQAMGFGKRVKLLPFDGFNISEGRNLGIAHAAGEIVAFIDDDSVPEPTWLDHLAEAFEDPEVGAAGGYVRAPDGISFQWKANMIDPAGRSIELDAAGKESFKPGIPEGFGIKTEGTNCAFRRETIAEIGGFDPTFRFFHDVNDLNMRLTREDKHTMLVPSAQVHHRQGPSERRQGDGTPKSLFEIGSSQMLFLRKYCPPIAHETSLAIFRKDERARLDAAMLRGGLEPRDIDRLMGELEDGLRDGAIRDFEPHPPIGPAREAFLPFRRENATFRPVYIAGRSGSLHHLRRRAHRRVEQGNVVTVFQFGLSAMAHRVRFDPDGFWVQSGGLFGRSIETEAGFRFCNFRSRVNRELNRVAYLRKSARNVTSDGDG